MKYRIAARSLSGLGLGCGHHVEPGSASADNLQSPRRGGLGERLVKGKHELVERVGDARSGIRPYLPQCGAAVIEQPLPRCRHHRDRSRSRLFRFIEHSQAGQVGDFAQPFQVSVDRRFSWPNEPAHRVEKAYKRQIRLRRRCGSLGLLHLATVAKRSHGLSPVSRRLTPSYIAV